MGKSKCQNPGAEPTKRQTFAVFCITKVDIRNKEYTRGEVSQIISDLKSKGKATTPDGIVLVSKNGKSNGSTPKSTWAVDLIAQAHKAGIQAFESKKGKVAPMIVEQHANPLDDNSPVEQQWVVEGGPCGFAWIRVKCTNSASRKFINQLKKAGLAGGENSHKEWSKSDYYGGFLHFVHVGGQSLAYKTAYGSAYTRVLLDAGINAFMFSRMD